MWRVERRALPADTSPERVLQAVLDASIDGIVLTDPGGVIVAWNRGAQLIYEDSGVDLAGRPLIDLVAPDQREPAAALFERLAAGRSIDPHDAVHTTKNGQRLDVVMAGTPITDATGAVVAACLVVRDMTRRRRAERALGHSEARWRAIIDTAVDGIIVIDRHGHIESCNPAAERLFGYRADEMLGRNVSMLMPAPHSADHDGYIRRYLTTREPHIIGIGREVTAQRKDGATFPVHLSVAELNIDGEVKFTGIIRDLTDRVKLEVQLREESGLVRLGELGAMLAHEVKNPLAAVSGAIQVLSERLTTAEEKEIADEILKRLDGLSAMMGDLLLYARPPKPKLGPVAVRELLESLVSFMHLDPAWQDVEVRVEGRVPSVLADAELLKVAFQNLLGNAVQAMDGHGKLEVRLAEGDRVIAVDITDSGPGIPPDIRSQIFTPFFTTKARGTGLGLATVRRIAEAHRGTVQILSTGAGGTTIRFSVAAHAGAARPD